MQRTLARLWLETFGFDRPRAVVCAHDADMVLYRKSKDSAARRIVAEWNLYRRVLSRYQSEALPASASTEPSNVRSDGILIDPRDGRVVPVRGEISKTELEIMKHLASDESAGFAVLSELFPEVDIRPPFGRGNLRKAYLERMSAITESVPVGSNVSVEEWSGILDVALARIVDDADWVEASAKLEADVRRHLAQADAALLAEIDGIDDDERQIVTFLRREYPVQAVRDSGFTGSALKSLWSKLLGLERKRPAVKAWDAFMIASRREGRKVQPAPAARIRTEWRLLKKVLRRYGSRVSAFPPGAEWRPSAIPERFHG